MVGLVALAGASAVGSGAVPAQAATGGYGDGYRGGAVALGVPAYWSAGDPAGAADFDRLVAAAATVDRVIVNGRASGPADPYDAALAAAIRRLADAGVTVLGYVDTGYLGRTGATTTRVAAGSTAVADWVAQADADAAAWQRLYGRAGLGGIFFDQTLPACGEGDEFLRAYADIADGVWTRGEDAVVAINPGMAVEECYTTVSDVIVVAENTLTAYRDWTPPPWVHEHPRASFWHLVHGADTPERMREAVALAQARNAGSVYVTDGVIDGTGGPWNALPAAPYWSAQVVAVRSTRVWCGRRAYPR
ncbi:MAG TPA: spherulation-specific family 4 protein [Micromonosporaceae bacterium]|nr:spherulation-specific family 4 protein [Micromonosporaceae bacterium]